MSTYYRYLISLWKKKISHLYGKCITLCKCHVQKYSQLILLWLSLSDHRQVMLAMLSAKALQLPLSLEAICRQHVDFKGHTACLWIHVFEANAWFACQFNVFISPKATLKCLGMLSRQLLLCTEELAVHHYISLVAYDTFIVACVLGEQCLITTL